MNQPFAAEQLTLSVSGVAADDRQSLGPDTQRQGWDDVTADAPLQLAPADLKDAQLAFGRWVDLLVLVALKGLLSQLVCPENDDRVSEQQMIEPLRIAELGLLQLTTAGFVIAERLFDMHAFQVSAQHLVARQQVGYERTQLGGLLWCGFGPGAHQLTREGFVARQTHIAKVARLTGLDPEFRRAELPAALRWGFIQEMDRD